MRMENCTRSFISLFKTVILRLAPIMEDEAEEPKVAPMVWISKWVDYSDKYGFGYALSDESIGVVYNDLTKLLLLSDGTLVKKLIYFS